MRALMAVVPLVLGGCAVTQPKHLLPFDPTAGRLSCPYGTVPVYVGTAIERQFGGCAETRQLGHLIR
jgi:hypothetical protein